jgi:hypothetical protein
MIPELREADSSEMTVVIGGFYGQGGALGFASYETPATTPIGCRPRGTDSRSLMPPPTAFKTPLTVD